MSDLASSFTILWASQTGNAEWIAKNIFSEAKQRGYSGECFAMEEWEKAQLDKARVLISVVSNTGDGDPPDHSLKFWRYLRRLKQPDYFKDCKIAILGLGDTNYTNFNNTARKLEKRLKDMGATVFHEKGLADDAEGLENVVDPWIEKLWDVLPTVLEKKGDVKDIKEDNVETVTEKMSQVEINPYSGEARSSEIAPSVDKYLDLPNSLVKKPTLHLGHVLQLDWSGLQPGVQLSGFPRLPAAGAKLTRLEGQQRSKDTLPSLDCVMTPTPITHASVTQVRCLTTHDAVKRTLHLVLDVGDQLEFEPGDAFGVVAPNDESLVEELLNVLAPSTAEAYQALYSVEGDSLPTHLTKAKSVTLSDLFRYAVDITTPPRKALLRLLADYTSDPQEKNQLMYLCSKQGASQFSSLREQVPTLLDILKTFPSCKPSIERLLDALPAHMPRYYSVANSPLKYPGQVHFAFNVIDYTTTYNVPRKGVATPWLDRLTGYVAARAKDTREPVSIDIPSGTLTVPIFKKHNSNAFVLPADTKRPLILIGPGTGIAPFVGFLEHRQKQRDIRNSMGGVGVHPSRDIQYEFGPIWVYYGFREQAKDYLFEQELKSLEKDGTITQLRLAASREQSGKVYVQDLLRQDTARLYDLIINQDAAIYVCGDAKGMAKGVNDVLADLLVQHHQVDIVQANKLLVEWMQSRKYLRDLWA
ncbi:riboflavin synthase domain-like protein [Lichtheimia hyalospora FSU 10163]|nr:riboflavin synthase domain-like protein [Lichtheimia hyalospora FSU 10163]